MSSKKYVASEMLLEATRRHRINLTLLVAETGIWAHPDVHARRLRETGSAAVFPNVRRARKGQGEQRGQILEGIRLDDNNYANIAIKRELGFGRGEIEGFEACHIWPLTCYDQRYHTAIANLVLLPRALASLSDHEVEIQAALQYRAFELYSWYPEGTPIPQKPAHYPSTWRSPEPPVLSSRSRSRRVEGKVINIGSAICDMSAEEQRMVTQRIKGWASKPHLNVHRIIGIVVRSNTCLSRDQLARAAEHATNTKNGYGAIASLLTSRANAYGRVLEDVDGFIRIHPAMEDIVRSFHWS